MPWKSKEPVETEIDPNRTYSSRELDEIASELLRLDARSIDTETGKRKGTKGDNPILLEDQLKAKQKREIQTAEGVPDPHLIIESGKPGRKTNNQPGMYFRTHPRGRKVNSDEQRRKHGASYFRN